MDKSKVIEALNEFNYIFKSKCKLLKIEGSSIEILFKGHVCFTCGTYDYFEDLAVKISEKLGKEYGVESYKQLEDGSYVVVYKPKEEIKKVRRDIKLIIYDYK